MGEFFDDRELEKNIKIEPHDYSKDIERLDKRMRQTQFSYIDAVMNRLKRVRRRAVALLLIGVTIAIATILLSSAFPVYDMDAYLFLISILPLEYNPVLSLISMLIPAVLVFSFLVWIHNRETRMYLYFAQKSEAKGKKARFVTMLVEPFLLLVAAIVSSAVLLTLFSLLGCNQFVCHFYDNVFRLSSNLLFNLLSLSFYLIFLGALQLKRYIGLVRLGIRDFYKEITL